MSDELETVAPDNDANAEVVGSVAFQAFFGPLPHPELLAGYEDVVPGAADRILTMTEEQQRHRMSMERGVLEINQSAQRGETIGQYISLALAVASAVVAIVLAITDPSWIIWPLGSPPFIWTAAWAVRTVWPRRDSDEAPE